MTEVFYQTTSSTVTVQDGEFAGQTVKHLHCHIMPRREGDFKYNDEIYIKLAKHDQTHDALEPRRSNEDMVQEATGYRQLFASQKFD